MGDNSMKGQTDRPGPDVLPSLGSSDAHEVMGYYSGDARSYDTEASSRTSMRTKLSVAKCFIKWLQPHEGEHP